MERTAGVGCAATDWTWVGEADFGDVECHHTGGDGGGAEGGMITFRSSGAHFHAQCRIWNQLPV